MITVAFTVITVALFASVVTALVASIAQVGRAA